MVSVSANADVSKRQLGEFKDSIKQGCVERGIERKNKNAVKFCTCMDDVLRSNLTDNDFQEIVTLTKAGQKPFGIPTIKALLPKIAECRVDVGS